jgi:hypothetical protein
MRRAWVLVASAALVTGVLAPGPAARAGGGGNETADKHVVRTYGGKPVAVGSNQVLFLRFQGREGDRVTLGGVHVDPLINSRQLKLLDDRETPTRVAIDPAGFLRLPSSGWFTLRYDGGPGQYLLELLQVQTLRPGHSAVVRDRRGFVRAFRVLTPRDGFLGVTGPDLAAVVAKGKGGSDLGHSVVMGAGFGVLGWRWGGAPLAQSLAARNGVVVYVRHGQSGRVAVRRARPASTAVDAPPAGTTRFGTVSTVSFHGRAGRLVRIHAPGDQTDHLAFPGAEDSFGQRFVLTGPRSGFVAPAFTGWENRGVHRLPYTGRYRVVSFPRTRAFPPRQVEVDSLVDVGELQIDGPPLRVAARPDGRWAVASFEGGNLEGYQTLTAENVTLSDPWLAYAGPLTYPCEGDTSEGCTILATFGEIGTMPDLNGWSDAFCCGDTVLVAPGTGTGTIDLRLTSAPTPPA